MKVTYIGHSGFAVELAQAVLVFDYYQGEMPAFPADKPIFVFASHKHADHFQHGIFELARQYGRVTFVLSKDCKMNEKYMARIGVPEEARGRIVYMGAREAKWFALAEASEQTSEAETLEAALETGESDDVPRANAGTPDNMSEPELLRVETLDSTDEGVAWIVTVGSRCIYHAGDLNWWTWVGEESEEEFADMTRRFEAEMARIEGRGFDVAFVPLDPRQGERYFWGLDAFMRCAEAARAFPMHFWEDYRVFDWIGACPEAAGYRERLVRIERPGQEFELE